MNKIMDYYNVVVGGVVTLLTAVFGALWYIFAAFFVLNIIDWLTGWYKSRRTGSESSRIGIKGVVKKLGYWAIVAVAFIMSNVFVHMGRDVLAINLDFLMLIGWFTLACLMVNEVRSILENLVECGYNVPTVLVKGLQVAATLITKDMNKEDEKDGK